MEKDNDVGRLIFANVAKSENKNKNKKSAVLSLYHA